MKNKERRLVQCGYIRNGSKLRALEATQSFIVIQTWDLYLNRGTEVCIFKHLWSTGNTSSLSCKVVCLTHCQNCVNLFLGGKIHPLTNISLQLYSYPSVRFLGKFQFHIIHSFRILTTEKKEDVYVYLKDICLLARLVSLRSTICHLLAPLSQGALGILLGCDIQSQGDLRVILGCDSKIFLS